MNEDAHQEDEEEQEEEEEQDQDQRDDQDGQDSDFSDSSDEVTVDTNVQLDMEKLQDSYPGFRQKYRLIKRIGEGMSYELVTNPESAQPNRR